MSILVVAPTAWWDQETDLVVKPAAYAKSIPMLVCYWREEPGSVAQLCQPCGWIHTQTRAASQMF